MLTDASLTSEEVSLTNKKKWQQTEHSGVYIVAPATKKCVSSNGPIRLPKKEIHTHRVGCSSHGQKSITWQTFKPMIVCYKERLGVDNCQKAYCTDYTCELYFLIRLLPGRMSSIFSNKYSSQIRKTFKYMERLFNFLFLLHTLGSKQFEGNLLLGMDLVFSIFYYHCTQIFSRLRTTLLIF